jgi:endo-1,4-beta-xylanase
MLSRRSLLAAASLPLIGQGSAQTSFPISNKNVSALQPVPWGGLYYPGIPEDALYSAAITKYCSEVVEGNKMSLELTQPTQGVFDFSLLDKIVAFAAARNMRMRGAHLIWGASEGKWIKQITSPLEMERAMRTYITSVMTRYPGRFYNYVVVNEAMPDDLVKVGDMRQSSYQKVLGDKHIELAFRIAAEADPKAQLMLNDANIEFNTPKAKLRREAFLKIIYTLLDKGVKIDSVGLQSHLHDNWEIDYDGMAKFNEAMKKANIKIHITELDVFDYTTPGNFAERDMMVARKVYKYLDLFFQTHKPASITTWGMTDKHFWGNQWFKRKDGLRLRGLPLDENYQPKLLVKVLEHFCKGAPLTL